MLKISENNGTEEIGLVTPTPGPHMAILLIWLDLACMCYYIHCEVWDVITYPFLNLNGRTVE